MDLLCCVYGISTTTLRVDTTDWFVYGSAVVLPEEFVCAGLTLRLGDCRFGIAHKFLRRDLVDGAVIFSVPASALLDFQRAVEQFTFLVEPADFDLLKRANRFGIACFMFENGVGFRSKADAVLARLAC